MNRTVEEMLLDIAADNRSQAISFWSDLCIYIPRAAGSTKSHHAWDYGYRDHVCEAMNLAYLLYDALDNQRHLSFSLSSALIVLFLHDCEKPFRNASTVEISKFKWIAKRPVKSDKSFLGLLIKHYGFNITKDQYNGLKYVEGEKNDYKEGVRTQGSLAAFCHICDTVSARIWFDYPKQQVADRNNLSYRKLNY